MPDLFSHRKLAVNRWPTRSLMILAVFGLLALGCDRGLTTDREARISELEGKVEVQERAIIALASAATLGRGSVFDSPLQRFFDAPEFWEFIEVDRASCHSQCAQSYRARLEACGDDEGCQDDAAEAKLDCHIQCGLGVRP